MKRNQGDLENFMYFSLSFFSILWSIWSYRNKASVKKEPFSATNVAMYFISLILMYRVIISSKIKEKPWQQQDKQIQSFREDSNCNQSCRRRVGRVGNGNSGDPISFLKIEYVHVHGWLWEVKWVISDLRFFHWKEFCESDPEGWSNIFSRSPVSHHPSS